MKRKKLVTKKTKKKDPKKDFERILGYFKSALTLLGLAAEVAADVAPLAGANKKTQADLEKARRASEAARQLSEGINKTLDAKTQESTTPQPERYGG